MTLVLGIALGVNVVLVGVLVGTPDTQTAVGQSANGTNGFLMTTGVLQGKGTSEALYIMDTTNRKLAVYFMNSRTLELLGVRDMQYDLIPQDFSPKGGRQDPSVQDMKEATRGG